MATLGSMAAWCVHRTGLDGASAEVHFNYWRIASKPRGFRGMDTRRDFAEIGTLVSDPTKIERIQIFLPFKMGDSDLQDCGPYFAKVQIAQGIFNEVLTCNSAGPPGPTRVELLKEGTLYCRVHLFRTLNGKIDDNQLVRSNEAEGTLLTITRDAINDTCHQLQPGCPAYFRLRAFLPLGDSQPFVEVTSPQDRYFQSGFEEIECVDFRLNEARTLPQRIESLMRTPPNEQAVSLTRVAFLTAIPVSAELTGTSIPTYKNRVLERGIWDEYVGTMPTGMMVYHWRNQTPVVKEFSAFVKLRIRRSSISILAVYLLIAFLFGIFGNLAASQIDRRWLSPEQNTSTKEDHR